MHASSRYITPSIEVTAFNCPHCHALAKQDWLELGGNVKRNNGKPFVANPAVRDLTFSEVDDLDQRKRLVERFERIVLGIPSLDIKSAHYHYELDSVHVSRCFNCAELAIWVAAEMIWPQHNSAPIPDIDMPADIRSDFLEAGLILDSSPRGAAALLRLCIQNLCIALGGAGKNIDNDIGMLVKHGLDARVQQALDIVRVVGNNAIHPGRIDLRDDRATAEKLFNLVNLIVSIMIGQPKHIAAMYAQLPQGALDAIERRDS